MSFGKGPFLALVKKPKDSIGVIRCACDRVREVRVNSSGWVYSCCYGASGCMRNETARGMAGAQELILQITKFEHGIKKKTLIMADLKDAPEPVTGDEPEPVARDEPEPVARDEPKDKTSKIQFTIFGKLI